MILNIEWEKHKPIINTEIYYIECIYKVKKTNKAKNWCVRKKIDKLLRK